MRLSSPLLYQKLWMYLLTVVLNICKWCGSKWTPRYLKVFVRQSCCAKIETEFDMFPGLIKKMHPVILIFTVWWLACDQRRNSWRSEVCEFIMFGLELEVRITVSSAYKKQFDNLNTCGRSLIYKRNNRDPKILPCGTPIKTVQWLWYCKSQSCIPFALRGQIPSCLLSPKTRSDKWNTLKLRLYNSLTWSATVDRLCDAKLKATMFLYFLGHLCVLCTS